MPLDPTDQEFWLKFNFRFFEWKLVDSIFRGPRNKWKNPLDGKKKKSIKICSIMLLAPTGEKFWPEYNLSVLARKLVDSIFRHPRNNRKNILQEKNIQLKFFWKCP